MKLERTAGLLLHPTSLPNAHGVGELGPEALRFVGLLREAGQGLWQMLPLNPTGPDGSPYSSPSAFAGNPLLVSTERLVEDGLVRRPRRLPVRPVDYPGATRRKEELLREAYSNAVLGEKFEEFREKEAGWLGDWALYAALKERFGGKPWAKWDEPLARRELGALEEARKKLAEEVRYHEFVQFLLDRHYATVRKEAEEAGVKVLGDLPIFVSQDSADVWANRNLFHLDEAGRPTVVAGVPPDYFSETGQLWGNPLYRWDRMQQEGYAWWTERMRRSLRLYDAVRIDHFRGLQAYWEVPADAETAKEGRWIEGPGEALFRALARALGDLPIVAEDLGDITHDVHALREGVGLPGMKVIQFGFSDPENPYLPHNYRDANFVVYTGTHDNDTASGWWEGLDREQKRFARRYLGRRAPKAWDFIRLAYASVAAWAIVPVQDVLELGSEARMNTPGVAAGNWRWRLEGFEGLEERAAALRELAGTYGR
jgi:4-alpha-glucanotransferase